MSRYENAVLVANGPLDPGAADRLRRAVSHSLVVGVDGGTRHLLALGIVPHVVTGDFDSLPDATRRTLATHVEIVPTPDQNFTDLDKALTYVQTRGCGSARVFAATEGRLDHTYSALSALLKHGKTCDMRLVDAFGETFCVNGALTLHQPDLPGRVLSLITLGEVGGITTTGVRWPLTNETLAPGVRDGTLNIVTSPIVTIAGTGDLLVHLQHAPPLPDSVP